MLDSNTIIIVASILGAALIGVGASFAATRGDSSGHLYGGTAVRNSCIF